MMLLNEIQAFLWFFMFFRANVSEVKLDNISFLFKVACRVQIWKKTFCQNSDYFGYRFIKNGIMFMDLLCIYKKTIIFNLFKIRILNFTVYILTILTCPLKTYVVDYII